MGKKLNLIGQRFNKLVVIAEGGRLTKRYNGKISVKVKWICDCDCGNKKEIFGTSLIQGKTISCGCSIKGIDPLGVKSLIGKNFGYLKVISYVKSAKWKCQCNCGGTTIVNTMDLKHGKTLSCGCLRKNQLRMRSSTHGLIKTSEYYTWGGMKERCMNPKSIGYKNYGGRGIKVCDRWVNSFEYFLCDMGIKPSKDHSLDRFPDVNGNYEPTNCRWATRSEQCRSKRNTKFIEYDGDSMLLIDWAKKLNVPQSTLGRYIRIHGIQKAVERYTSGIREWTSFHSFHG